MLRLIGCERRDGGRARTGFAFLAAVCAFCLLPVIHTHAAEPAAKAPPAKGNASVSVVEQPFGSNKEGGAESLFVCTNRQASELKLTSYGARIVSLSVPDRDGKQANVVLGFPAIESYLAHKAFFGCTTGRFANRIAKGRFSLGGHDYQLAVNNEPNHLHGGVKGFDRRHWEGKVVEQPKAAGVEFSYRSVDGEEGYPGNLDVKVKYLWSDDNTLTIDYTATADKPTILNLTNHAYWNLGGVKDGKPIHGTILDEELTLAADKYLPTDSTSIPTGELAPVAGTVMDFTKPQRIGERIDKLKQAPSTTKGYDHCYVLRSQDGTRALAARVADPKTGRVMEVHTTEPGIQLYTGNFLEGDVPSGGFNQHEALCLETQHYPDSPNRPEFPSTVLKPGQTYRQTTVHKFSIE